MIKRINYEISLRKFLRENPGSTEIDYLNEKIAEAERLIEKGKNELENYTISQTVEHLKKILDCDFNTYPKYGIPEDWVKNEHSKQLKKLEYSIGGKQSVKKEYELTLSRLPQPQKKDNSSLFRGKKFNLSERFSIANKYSNLWKSIDQLNLPDLKKYEILAVILNCNPDNARKLVLGKYDSKDRTELLSEFYNEMENGQK